LTSTPVLSANTTLEKSTIFTRDSETVVDPALHVGGVVHNRVEPSALVYRQPAVSGADQSRLRQAARDGTIAAETLRWSWTVLHVSLTLFAQLRDWP
jgi:hypothetical protein